MTTRTEQEIIQDQVAEKAKYAASVAAASGNVAKDAFMKTVSGAKTIGEKAVVFGALIGIVSFFLPWITLFSARCLEAGLRIALDASAWFWLYPVSMILCFVTSSFNKAADVKRGILGARWYIVDRGQYGSPCRSRRRLQCVFGCCRIRRLHGNRRYAGKRSSCSVAYYRSANGWKPCPTKFASSRRITMKIHPRLALAVTAVGLFTCVRPGCQVPYIFNGHRRYDHSKRSRNGFDTHGEISSTDKWPGNRSGQKWSPC